MRFELFITDSKKHSFRVTDPKGAVLLMGNEFKEKEKLMQCINNIKQSISDPTWLEKEDAPDGQYYFKVINAKGQLVATSRMFINERRRDIWYNDIQKELPQLDVVEIKA